MSSTAAEAYSLSGFEAREVPRIGGSSAAFVVVIVILLLVILVAGGGIVYLLREDGETSTHQWQARRRIGIPKGSAAHGGVDDEDEEALDRRPRGAYQRQRSSDSAPHDGGGGWTASIKRLIWKARRRGHPRHPSGSGVLPQSDSVFSPQGQMRRYSSNPAPQGRQQGWMQAASESDWDLAHNAPSHSHSAGSSDHNNLRMVERKQTDSPLMGGSGSPRSSYFAGGGASSSYPYPYSASRMNTSESIASSVVRFDDSVNLPVRHGSTGGGPTTAPSILSGRYFASPTTSPTGSSSALPLASPTSLSRPVSPVHLNRTVSSAAPSSSSHGAAARPTQQKLPSRMTMTSASEVSLARSESYPSHEYVLANHSPFPAPSPSIRTFGSGSRFVEGL